MRPVSLWSRFLADPKRTALTLLARFLYGSMDGAIVLSLFTPILSMVAFGALFSVFPGDDFRIAAFTGMVVSVVALIVAWAVHSRRIAQIDRHPELKAREREMVRECILLLNNGVLMPKRFLRKNNDREAAYRRLMTLLEVPSGYYPGFDQSFAFQTGLLVLKGDIQPEDVELVADLHLTRGINTPNTFTTITREMRDSPAPVLSGGML